LVSTKSDLGENKVSQSTIDDYCLKRGIKCYLPTSAREGTNVDYLFEEVARGILAKKEENEPVSSMTQYVRASGSEALVAAFDVDDLKSFEAVDIALEQNKKDFGAAAFNEVNIILVGTKSKFDKKDEVTQEKIDAYCKAKGIRYYVKQSIENGTKLDKLLERIAEDILAKQERKPEVHFAPTPVPVKPITENKELRAEVKRKLLDYSTRVEGQKNGKSGYSEGFWCTWGLFGYTKISRAINRQANHLLANELLTELDTKKDISEIFANVKERRSRIISEQGLNTNEGYVERDLNCTSELYGIIEDAKKTFSR
jgi:hypothetical protein